MLKNYLYIALRNLQKHKAFAFINVIGLSIGIASSILILLFVWDELIYDRFHTNIDRTYRVVRERGTENISYTTKSPGAIANALKNDFPEIEQIARVWGSNSWMYYKDKGFRQRLWLADPALFDIFTFPALTGDPKTALQKPGTILLTQKMADKYFGSEDPIGKTLRFEHRSLGGEYTVAGILQNIPKSSTFQFDFLTAHKLGGTGSSYWDQWLQRMPYSEVETYLLLADETDAMNLEQKLPEFVARYIDEEFRPIHRYHLQAFSRIHLYSRQDFGITWYSDITYVQILSLIGIFLLMIACINFMNLATARSVIRSKEVGLRKVVGARRVQLIGQFLGESTLFSFIALMVGLVLASALLPIFNTFIDRDLSLATWITQGWTLLALFALTLSVGILAGSYPAFFLSSFNPQAVLKRLSNIKFRGLWLRRGLVILQFAISITLIIGSLIVYRQLSYLQSENLGFDRDHIVYMPFYSTDRSQYTLHEGPLSAKYNTVKDAFLKHPNIRAVSASMHLPGWGGGPQLFGLENTPEQDKQVILTAVDEDFFETYGIEVVAGRNFDREHVEIGHIRRRENNIDEHYIINEAAAKMWGWENPIGKYIQNKQVEVRRAGPIIGVIADYHLRPLHEKLGPVVIWTWREKMNWLSIKIRSENVAETMQFIEQTWSHFLPNRPFDPRFMDDRINQFYQQEQRFAHIIAAAFTLTIVIACLGLFGLVSFTATQRTKEIGIRKTLGASVPSIFSMLSLDFVRWIIVSNLIAWPIVYFIMQKWLEDFAYRISLSPLYFIIGGGLTLIIAFITVSYQTFKAARANPIDALRYE